MFPGIRAPWSLHSQIGISPIPRACIPANSFCDHLWQLIEPPEYLIKRGKKVLVFTLLNTKAKITLGPIPKDLYARERNIWGDNDYNQIDSNMIIVGQKDGKYAAQ